MHGPILAELSRPENRDLLVVGLWCLVASWVMLCALVLNRVPQRIASDLRAFRRDCFPPKQTAAGRVIRMADRRRSVLDASVRLGSKVRHG
jgi:hypothetical protein